MNRDASCVGPLSTLPEHITIYATSEDARIWSKLRNLLQSERLTVADPYDNVLSVSCTANQLAQLNPALAAKLRPPELALIRCRLVPASVDVSLAELMQTQSLGELMAWIDGLWLDSLLTSHRLMTYFQPIVRNEQPDEVFAYECLLRGREEDGELIFPDRLLAAARATGTLSSLDRAARLTAIESASKMQLDTCIFINFIPQFIEEPSREFKQTIEATQASGIPTERFIFEVVESDEIVDFDRLLRVLDYCRDAGCRVALDDLGAGYSSLNLMALVKPDFVKLDMGLIRDVDKDMYKSCVASKLLELARELGAATVVEGVETYGEWNWATEHGADFSQGYLFARPDAVPPVSRVPSKPSDALDGSESECSEQRSVKNTSDVA